jgi:predicted amidohydrolase
MVGGGALMRLAILQMQSKTGDVTANLDRIAAAAAEAAAGGADLLVAPELAVTGYGAGEAIRELAEPVDGPQVSRLIGIAVDAGLAVIAGFAERANGVLYNSAALVTAGGPPVVYRKSHLYGDYERDLFSAGDPTDCIAGVAGLKVGMLVCYDVEFPENVRRLSLAGADLVAVPTALPAGPYSRMIAERVIPVRAFENQIFIAYADLCGRDARFAYCGLSHIAAPDGATLAIAPATGEALLHATIDPGAYAQSRIENAYLRDLR